MVLCKMATDGVPCTGATMVSAFGSLAAMIVVGYCKVYPVEGVAFRNRQWIETRSEFPCPYKAIREPVEAVKSRLNPLKAAKRAQRTGVDNKGA